MGYIEIFPNIYCILVSYLLNIKKVRKYQDIFASINFLTMKGETR